MSTMTMKTPKIDYWLTILNAYFLLSKEKGSGVEGIDYEDSAYAINAMKKIGIKKNINTTKIFASGVVFDMVSTNSGAELTTDVIALPSELLNELEGGEIIHDSFFVESNVQDGKEFGFAFALQTRANKNVYIWYPRCKLTPSEETAETQEGDFKEKNQSYVITAMPTKNGLLRVKYETASVPDGKIPLTIEEFIALKIVDKKDIPEHKNTPIEGS